MTEPERVAPVRTSDDRVERPERSLSLTVGLTVSVRHFVAVGLTVRVCRRVATGSPVRVCHRVAVWPTPSESVV